ncbi:MAG: aldo/keto reductase [Holophagae bacterium]|nr:MAG: aldo/keto reductase [Holophagae bacterium]
MRYRRLGRAGFEVSEVAYGAWGIGGLQWLGGTDAEARRALQRSFSLGLNFIDTALAYGDGHSERLVGQVVRGAGGRVFVASKVPPKNDQWPARRGIGIEQVFPYDYVIACTEQSLRNLGLEALDLQQLHVWNPEWFDRDDWRRAFRDLKESGKVRAVGVSINDHDPDSALELVRSGLVDAVQVIYNIFDQSPERQLLPVAQQMDVGVIARVPFDEGALTGTVTEATVFLVDDFRTEYFAGDRKRQVAERVAALERDFAGTPGTLPEIALRFCLSHPAVSTVIPGMRTVRHVESNLAVSDAGPLDAPTLAILRRHAWDKNFYGE